MPRTNQQRLVNNRLWELIEPLLARRPAPKVWVGGRGSMSVPRWKALFVLHIGCRWRDLPARLGYGSGHTAWRRLRAGP